jgi:hypothetical protein
VLDMLGMPVVVQISGIKIKDFKEPFSYSRS